MRRILRYTFLTLWALTCLALVVLWVRGSYLNESFTLSNSYMVDDLANAPHCECHVADFSLNSSAGHLMLSYTDDYDDGSWPAEEPLPPPITPGYRFSWFHQAPPNTVALFVHPAWHDRLGFSWLHERYHGVHTAGESRILLLPTWFVFLLIVLPSLPFARRAYRRRRIRMRRAAGLCLAYGYDLRATPTCCPECGSLPSTGNERHR